MRGVYSYLFVLSLAFLTSGALGTASTAHAQDDDYVMLKIAGKEMRASEVLARWERLFPPHTAPDFEAVSPTLKRNFLESIAAEVSIYETAVKAKFDKEAPVEQALETAKRQALIHAWLHAQTADDVSEAALKDAYDRKKQQWQDAQEIRVSHILLDREEEAREVYDALQAGKSFTSLVKAHSKDPLSAQSGGDLGYLLPEDMYKSFADAALALKKDVVSTPVKTDLGWHIIKVTDVRTPDILPYHVMKQQLVHELQDRTIARYVSQLVKQAGVVVLNSAGDAKALHDITAQKEGFLF